MAKPTSTYQKLRGGYYTPRPIGEFLANWAIQSPVVSVLEPSCGDGELLACIYDRLRYYGTPLAKALSLTQGIEIDGDEARKAEARFQNVGDANIHIGDFFAYCEQHLAS